MNDELKAKLKQIVMRFGWITEDDDWERAIADIDQAYKDAGYENKTDWMEGGGYLSLEESPVVQWLHDNGWMTGQEWYERFEKEYDELLLNGTPPEHAGHEAAKRVAGITY